MGNDSGQQAGCRKGYGSWVHDSSSWLRIPASGSGSPMMEYGDSKKEKPAGRTLPAGSKFNPTNQNAA
jgi:hypothetical protein